MATPDQAIPQYSSRQWDTLRELIAKLRKAHRSQKGSREMDWHKEAALKWIREQGEPIAGSGAPDVKFRIALMHALLYLGDQLEKAAKE